MSATKSLTRNENLIILDLMREFLEKQDMLNKLTENSKLNSFGYSDIHTIRAIEDLDKPNVTAIAETLKMTRGAISKICRKLQEKELIESYRMPGNMQKVFFRLTPSGKELYNAHEDRHILWEKRDLDFLSRFDKDELSGISDFMKRYNDYLQQQIDDLSGDEK